MRPLLALLALAFAAAALPPVASAQDVAGRFDYYVLSLSWSPSWCAQQGKADRAAQCDPGRRLGFVVHGLWPQYEQGWPSDCRSGQANPSRRESAAMADIMGSGGLAWYQWKKHGRCSGLSPQDYFALTRQAAQTIRLPEVLTKLPQDVTLAANVVEDAFIETNPRLGRDSLTVTCRARALQEVRICLTRDLQPRACGADVQKDCSGRFEVPAPR